MFKGSTLVLPDFFIRGDGLQQHSTQPAARERAQRRQQRHPHIHPVPRQKASGGRHGPYASGKFVGACRHHRGQPRQIIRRQADKPAAPGHAIHKARQEAQRADNRKHLPGQRHNEPRLLS